MKKLIAFGVIILFFFVSVIPSTGTIAEKKSNPPILDGNTLYVGGSGGGNYSTIQSAINDANPGDTVFVFDESSPYYEHVTLNKVIDLIGEDKNTTIIDAEDIGSVIVIDSPGVNITGFTIRKCEYYPPNAGIRVKTSDNRIYGNIISKNEGYGIYIQSPNNLVFDNIISENNYGINIETRRNEIINNHIKNNYNKGIQLLRGNNLISGNSIIYNGDGGLWTCGIQIWYGENNEYNEIINNVISNNNPTGIIVE